MRRLQMAAGVAFVSAWLVGLALATDGPKPDDPAATIAAYYGDHEVRSMIATLLIDGLAGLAIFALAYCLWRYLSGEPRLGKVVLWAGIGAATASLVQMVTGLTMAYHAGHGGSPDGVETLFRVLNNGDTVKIALLAVTIAAASLAARRLGAFPRWLAAAGLVFAPPLAVSGLAFPLESDALYASLA